MKPTRNFIDKYEQYSYLLANGPKFIKEQTLRKIGHEHSDGSNMLVLHDEIKRQPQQSVLFATTLGKFLSKRNADFIANLLQDPQTYSTHFIAICYMQKYLIAILRRSLDRLGRKMLKGNPSDELILSLFQDHAYWQLYLYTFQIRGSGSELETFKNYADTLNYCDARIKMRELLLKGDDVAILSHLPYCRKDSLHEAIRYLHEHETPGLLATLENIESKNGPLHGFPFVQEIRWELEGKHSVRTF